MRDDPRRIPGLTALFALCAAVACSSDGSGRAPTEAPRAVGMCASCHGPTGRSPLPGTPHIAGQDAEYLVLSMLQYRQGQRPHAAMRAVMGSLSEAEIRELAHWYAGQDPCPGKEGG